MNSEISSLWALVAGIFLLVANAGAILMLEGLTRRRRALTVSARHLGGASGAVLGSLAPALLGFDAVATTSGQELASNAQLWLSVCTAVLLTTLAMAGTAERSTTAAHVMGGLLIGAVLAPLTASARQVDGFLTSIQFGERGFVDVAAGSVFALAGWIALVGTMIIGPRRGRGGRDGLHREISGKSMPLAMIGALIMFSTLFGILARPGEPWDEAVINGAIAMAAGGAAGVVAGVLVSRVRLGDTRTTYAVHGLLAGVVSTTGAPLTQSLPETLIFGAVGALLAHAGRCLLESRGIDDPAGIVSACGIAGIWGSVAVGVANPDQFFAQLFGSGLIGIFAVVSAGMLFALLRGLRLLRVRPDIEVAGLEL